MPESPVPGQILVVSNSAQVARPAADVLRWAKHRVVELETRQEAERWLQQNPSPSLAVVELDLWELAGGGESLALLAALRKSSGNQTPVIGLIRRPEGAPMLALFERARLMNFLIMDGELDTATLVITASKLLGQDIFGVERYLGPGATHREYMVDESAQRPQLIQTAEAFAQKAGCHARVIQRVAQIADELLSNALYDAPLDINSERRFKGLPRTVPLVLDEGEEVFFRLASDGKRVALAVTDPFGSLEPDTVLDYLAKGFARGDDQIDNKPGGAGLGLYSLFSMLHHFVINIHPGRQTEVIGILEVTRSYREFAAYPKSFNLFVTHTG